MNRIIIALLVVVITLISITLYNVLSKNVPKAENVVSNVNELLPRMTQTYNNICSKGITVSAKKGSIGTILGKKIPDNDMNVNVKIPC